VTGPLFRAAQRVYGDGEWSAPELGWVCCVGRWDRSPMTGYVARLALEAGRECGERDPHSIMDGPSAVCS
jgi:hypothetical protein